MASRALLRLTRASSLAVSRALPRALPRAPSSLLARPHLLLPFRAPLRIRAATVRYYSAGADGPASKSYDFESIQKLSQNPDPDRIIIDVREPHEFAAGHIPTALNLPITSAPDGIFLPAHEFADRFSFPKPAAGQELVFYCKAGVRSRAAAELARQAGYRSVGEYAGSWLDWEKRGGVAE